MDTTNSVWLTQDTTNDRFDVYSLDLGHVGSYTVRVSSTAADGSVFQYDFTLDILDPCLTTVLTIS